MNPRLTVWRLLAVLGPAAVLLQQGVASLPWQPRQAVGLVAPVLAVPAVALTCWLLMPSASARLRRNPDLLIPLGVVTFAYGVLGWLLLIPPVAAVLTPSKALKLWTISLTLSASFVLNILLAVAYAAWATGLILAHVRHDRADPGGELANVPRRFLRTFGLGVVGWGVLFAGLAVAVAVGAAALPLALLLIGAGSLAWNLMTVALLPVGLDDRLGFLEGVRAGLGVSVARLGRWWAPVVAQLLLLGLGTFAYVSYSESRAGAFTTHSSFTWGVNGFWVGGYEDECRWYGKWMEALKAPKLPPVATFLGLVFGVLAVVIKLHVAERLDGPYPPGGHPGEEEFAGQKEYPEGFTSSPL